jgi:hypothetical protein
MLPLLLGVIFAIWGGVDLVSYAATGNDSITNLAVALGWTGTLEADAGTSIILVWGMSVTEFLLDYWIFVCMFLAVVFLTFWASTRPIKPKGGRK